MTFPGLSRAARFFGGGPAARLRRLLEREAESLRTGRVDALSALQPERDRALAAVAAGVSSGAVTANEARALTRAAERNQRLLKAAAEGLRSAKTRLAEIERQSRGDSGHYGADGQRVALGTAPRHDRKV